MADFPQTFTFPFVTPSYLYTGTGGGTFGGAATTELHLSSVSYTGSGGGTFGGAATTTTEVGYAYTGSGGAVFGGAADTTQTDTYPYTGSGGGVFGGIADTEWDFVPGLTATLTTTSIEQIHATVVVDVN